MSDLDRVTQALPRAAVSAAIFHDGRVLLVKRRLPPSVGLWSLPGGHIEPGEHAVDAARREVAEETSVEARLIGIAGVNDVVQRNDRDDVLFHRVIIVFYGTWEAGEPRAASDAVDAGWYGPRERARLALTEGLEALIEAAAERLRAENL